MNAKSTYEESELVKLLKQKDNQAFSYLYNNYGNALYGIIKQIVGDAEIGNDVLQEVFINIWRRIESYDPSKGRLFTWMLNIARNAAIDKTRSKHYKESLKFTSITDNELSHPIISPGYDDYGLKKLIHKLKNEERMLIDLSYYHGFTQDQIAKALNIPLGTVKTRLRHALAQLRTMLT